MLTKSSILCNMYYQGTVRHDTMATLKTKNYIIDFVREDATQGLLPIQYEYRCIIVFKDILNRELKRISINESQARTLIDSIEAFVYEDYEDMMCLTSINGNTIYESYGIKLICPDQNKKEVVLQLIQFFPQGQNLILSISLTLDELDDMVSTMFFIFLIDLEAERRGIFKV